MKFKLSASSINLMKECPRCFWLDKHKIWKRPKGIFPSLPSGMDYVIKKHFDKYRDLCQLPPSLSGNEHCNALKLFNNKELIEVWRDNFKGLRYTDSNGNILIGAVDDLLQNIKTGKVIPFEFKTRGFDVNEKIISLYQNQLNIYSFLLKENNCSIENYALLLFFIPREIKGGSFSCLTHLVKIQTNPDSGKALFDKAIKLLNTSCPTEKCEWCKNIS